MNESDEQRMFVQWLRVKGIVHSSIPSSFFIPDRKTKDYGKVMGMINKMRAEGWVKGVPDLLLIVKCHDGKHRVVFIEMKQAKTLGKRGKLIGGGTVSPEQHKWLANLEQCEQVGAYVAHGADEAIRIVTGLMT